MTHTMTETAELKEQLDIIKGIHEKVADAVDGKPYPCAMSALTSIMIELYNHFTDEPGIEDFMNKFASAYMANEYINKGEGATKQ